MPSALNCVERSHFTIRKVYDQHSMIRSMELCVLRYWPRLLHLSSPSKSCANERSIASRQSILSSLAYSQSETLGAEHYQMIVGDILQDGVHKSSLPSD
jgi:hypothetical protein